MKYITPQKLIVVLIMLLAISIPILAITNQNFISGQLFSYVGKKIGIVQNDITSATDDSNAIRVPTVISIPVPAEGDVPFLFKSPETEISTKTTAWGKGTPIVAGESVIIK